MKPTHEIRHRQLPVPFDTTCAIGDCTASATRSLTIQHRTTTHTFYGCDEHFPRIQAAMDVALKEVFGDNKGGE